MMMLHIGASATDCTLNNPLEGYNQMGFSIPEDEPSWTAAVVRFIPVTVSRTFRVNNAGYKTYYLNGRRVAGGGKGYIWESSMQAVYYPDSATPACTGTVVDGLQGCWFLGEFERSCNEVCAARGLAYSDLTRTVAGSGASNEACLQVLQTLAAPTPRRCDGTPLPVIVTDVTPLEGDPYGTGGHGCYSWHLDTARCDSQGETPLIRWQRETIGTTAEASRHWYEFAISRACACQ